MINVTNSAIVEKIKGTGRTFTLSIKVGTNTFTEVKSLRRSSIFASNQKLSVGEAVSAFIEAEINDCRESLQNYEVEPILKIDGYNINIPLGIFKVQAPSQADGSGTQKITAYDRMSETSKYTYTATGLTSAKSTFSAICSTCGYTAITSGLTDVSINDKLLNGMDCRKALGYVAGVFGKNCVVGTDGKFKMVGYSNVSESTCKISINSLDTLEFPSKVSTIDYFNAVVNESTIYKSGSGNSGVNIVNPLFKSISQTANILSYLKSNVGSNGYYPAKFKQLNGDPRIEVGDVIKVEHKNIATGSVVSDYVPVMSLVLDYDGGVSVSIEAYPAESEFSMSLSDLMDFTNSSNNSKFENLEGNIGGLNSSFNDLSGKVDGFAEDILTAKGKADFATVRAEAVKELNDLVSNSLGLYRTEIEGAGGDIKYYFHNKATLAQSNYIISMTDSGFAYTNNWNNGDPVWTYGINPAGNSIMNYLVANKISADLIEAGVISSLEGAPIKTEFSLNTGLMSLIATAKKQGFAFGSDKSNNLLLQYNYSESDKINMKSGYYYNGQFYADVQHKELITPSSSYYYVDITSVDVYEYSDGYNKLTDLTELAKTFKGFIMHSNGVTYGYEAHDEPNLLGYYITSDFTLPRTFKGGILGFYEDEYDDVAERTPILKFYDYEIETSEANPHLTEIRKQSISTKYLGAEKIAFYLDGRAVDLESLFTSVSNEFDYLRGKVDVLEKEIVQLKTALNLKTLAVFVSANPSDAGSVSGSGSYILQDGSFVVGAEAKSGTRYYISSVNLTYTSDDYSQTFDQRTLINKGWLTNSNTSLGMPVDILSPRLGDTLNVTVYFGEPEKHNVTLIADPANGGTVSGGGFCYHGDTARIVASPYEDYDFVGWYEQGKFLTSSPVMLTQAIYEDKTYTAKFERKPEELTISVGETKLVDIGAGEIVYLKFTPSTSGTYEFTSLGTSDDDVMGYLYDADKSEISSNDDDAGNRQFLLSEDLTANVTYYWGIKYYSSSKTGSINVKLTFKGSSGGETPTTFTLTTKVSPEGAGSVSVDKAGPYSQGDVVWLTATAANSNYQLSHWHFKHLNNNQEYDVEKNTENPNKTSCSMYSDTEVTAVFEYIGSSGGGTTSGTTKVKVSGVNATSTDVVFINQVGTTEVNITPGSSCKIYAYATGRTISKVELYTDGTYLDDINLSGFLTSTADGDIFEYGLVAGTESAGHTTEFKVHFSGGSSGGSSGGTGEEFLMKISTNNASYGTVTVTVNGTQQSPASGYTNSYKIRVGDTVTLQAIPSAGHSFSMWSNGTSILPSGATHTFTATTADVNFVAYFS